MKIFRQCVVITAPKFVFLIENVDVVTYSYLFNQLRNVISSQIIIEHFQTTL